MASPTSAGIGNTHSRRPLPHTRRWPRSQSQSSSCNAMISWARKPSRARSNRTARSRSPIAVLEVAAVDRALRMFGRYRSRQWRSGGPRGHGRDGGNEFAGDVAAVLAVAQERAHRVGDALQRRQPQTIRLAPDELDDVGGSQFVQVDRVAAEALRQELPRDRRVTLDRGGSQASVLPKVLLVAGHRASRRASKWSMTAAHTPCACRKRSTSRTSCCSRRRVSGRTGPATPVAPNESFDMAVNEIGQLNTLLLEPTVQRQCMSCPDVDDGRRRTARESTGRRTTRDASTVGRWHGTRAIARSHMNVPRCSPCGQGRPLGSIPMSSFACATAATSLAASRQRDIGRLGR